MKLLGAARRHEREAVAGAPKQLGLAS